MKRLASLLLLLLALAAAIAWARLQLSTLLDAPSPASGPTRIEVAPGTPLRGVLAGLQRRGVVRHARLLELYLRLRGEQPRIQAGRYEIAAHASTRQIVQQLAEGRVLLASLTVVEGWSFDQMRAALAQDPDVTHQLAGLGDAQLMQALGHPGLPAEGRFFPDTYRFASGTPDRRIYEMAFERMQQTLQAAWATRAAGLPLQSPEQALTLASIVEKETGRPEERALVAAVFVNRLRMGMRLQSDPTVIYGLGPRYDGSLHAHDLQTDTPYNTYTRAGLPPTPIALPGAASLYAALHPADSAALYFVATGEGTHHFSSTLAEQDVALRAWLRHLRQTRGANEHAPVSAPAAPSGHARAPRAAGARAQRS